MHYLSVSIQQSRGKRPADVPAVPARAFRRRHPSLALAARAAGRGLAWACTAHRCLSCRSLPSAGCRPPAPAPDGVCPPPVRRAATPPVPSRGHATLPNSALPPGGARVSGRASALLGYRPLCLALHRLSLPRQPPLTSTRAPAPRVIGGAWVREREIERGREGTHDGDEVVHGVRRLQRVERGVSVMRVRVAWRQPQRSHAPAPRHRRRGRRHGQQRRRRRRRRRCRR